MTLATTAQRLINREGRTVTLHLAPAAPTDANKPWLGNATPPAGATLTLKAVFDSQKEGELAKTLFAALTGGSGAPPRRPRNSFIVAGLDLGTTDVSTIMEVTDGSQLWRVTGVEPIKPGDTLFAAILEVRQ